MVLVVVVFLFVELEHCCSNGIRKTRRSMSFFVCVYVRWSFEIEISQTKRCEEDSTLGGFVGRLFMTDLH